MRGVVVGALAVATIAAVAVAGGSSGTSGPTVYSLVGRQAQEVAVTTAFVNAFNAHNLQRALATFVPNTIGSDCDYRHGRVVRFNGKREIKAWLRRRFADDDHLAIARIFNDNAAQPMGGLGIDWRTRTSATLRRMGFPRGIVPQLSAKVVFSRGFPPRIGAFANGPGGADASFCRTRR
jgi:hypothetical protein